MQAYVGTFRVSASPSTEALAVTGIVDRAGVAFTPEYVFFVNGSSLLETIYSNPPGAPNGVTANTNFLRVSDVAAGYAAHGDLPQFGAKIVSGGGGTGPNSVLCGLEPNAGFGGFIWRYASLASVGLGTFTLNITSDSPAPATDVMFLALAGSAAADLVIGPSTDAGGSIPVTDAKGLLNVKMTAINVAGTNSTAAGGQAGFGFGWDSPDGGPMASHVYIVSQGGNLRYQRTTEFDNALTDGPPAPVAGASVTAWNPSDIIISAGRSNGYVVSGANLLTTSGPFTQPTTPGTQVIDLRINARAVFLLSVGAPASASVRTDWAEMCVAILDGTRGTSYWFGEIATASPVQGAGFLSATSVFRFASAGPNGASTVFTSTAQFVSLQTNGLLTLNWTATDGVARELLWFALGTAPINPIIPPTICIPEWDSGAGSDTICAPTNL